MEAKIYYIVKFVIFSKFVDKNLILISTGGVVLMLALYKTTVSV